MTRYRVEIITPHGWTSHFAWEPAWGTPSADSLAVWLDRYLEHTSPLNALPTVGVSHVIAYKIVNSGFNTEGLEKVCTYKPEKRK